MTLSRLSLWAPTTDLLKRALDDVASANDRQWRGRRLSCPWVLAEDGQIGWSANLERLAEWCDEPALEIELVRVAPRDRPNFVVATD